MNNTKLESYQDWRYERKVRVANLGVRGLEALILSNCAFFRPIYEERQVNNIYFDDIDLNCFVSNIEGDSDRQKFRIRWYGDVFEEAKNPVLEIKIKDSMVGAKLRYKLENFTLERNLTNSPIEQCIDNTDLPIVIRTELKRMRPTLINKYKRRYYISSDGKYRLTLDYDMVFYKLEAKSGTILSNRKHQGLVVEVKYDVKDDNGIDRIVNDLGFRLAKNSKYAIGIESTRY